jgi:hypothetical protein
MRKAFAVAVLAAALAVFVAVAAATNGKPGFKTAQGPMIDPNPVIAGASYQPIISVGDTLPGGYMFESIPDGIAIAASKDHDDHGDDDGDDRSDRKGGRGGDDDEDGDRDDRRGGRHDDDDDDDDGVDIYVNHETSTVPFPFIGSTGVGFNDFTNALVSKLELNPRTGGVLNGRYVITSDQNYQRFCSSFLATTKAQGFDDRALLLTNEEGIDWVNRSGEAWPAVIGSDAARQIGVVVAVDEKSGKSRPIWGMGRHNHENSVAVPGYGKPVVLSGDDSFVSNPAQAQLYSYIAKDGDAVWKDRGDLWAFVADAPGVDDYYDFPIGSTMSVSGRFVKVPKDIATGRAADGSELMAADKGYPLPPSDGTWQRDPNNVGIDGPQWVLEHWGDTQAKPVFQFTRVEDIAYDRRRGMENVVYVVDSGRGATSAGGNAFTSSNGRIWKLVLDPKDPTRVLSFSILIEGDDAPVKAVDEMHQPDNIESTKKSLLFTEDPGSSQQFPVGSTDPAATTARIWQFDLATGTKRVAAKVNQSADEGPTDVDAAPRGNQGAWESSGIVDASKAFGAGAFLINVQAHTLWIERAPGEDNNGNGQPDFTYKREGGQLLLIRIPGG